MHCTLSSASIFVDVPYSPSYSSSLVLYRVLCSGSFTLAKRLYSHGLIPCENGGCSRISHCQQHKKSHNNSGVTPCIVMKSDGILYYQESLISPEHWTKVALQECVAEIIVQGALSFDEENRDTSIHLIGVWASSGFVQSNDSSKKVITFHLVLTQQGLCAY